MRLSRSPELIPVTIDSSTCSGVAVDWTITSEPIVDILSIYSSVLRKATIHPSERYGKIDDTIMSREIPVKRKYELKKRAREMAETRLRITEAAIELHGTVGPSRTTLSEAAEVLTAGRQVRGRRRQLLRRALRHALAFSTWRSLSTSGIGRSDAAKLTTALVEAAAVR